MAARYEHFQSATHISVSFFAKGVDRAASAVTLSPEGTELEARFVLPGGEPLFACSIPLLQPAAAVAVSFTSMRCEARLLKRVPGMWAALELPAGATRAPLPAGAGAGGAAGGAGAAAAAEAPAAAAAAAAAAATAGAAASSAASAAAKKNWSQLEKEVEAEEAAAKPEGEEALMKLFRGIYKDASEETRKAMVKSFQTSGGTVLSTNWAEVKETDYEKKLREEREGKGGGGGGGAAQRE
jgi:hypothetical protein